MSRISLDIGVPPVAGRSRKGSAAKHGRTSSNVPDGVAVSPGVKPVSSPSSPRAVKPASPPNQLFAIPDGTPSYVIEDPFSIFDPLALKPAANPPARLSIGQKPPPPVSPPPAHPPPSAVPAAANHSADPFASLFSGSSSSSSTPAKKGEGDKSPRQAKGKKGKKDEDDEDSELESASEEESEEESEDDEQEEGARKKLKKKGHEKVKSKKNSTKGAKEEKDKEEKSKKSEAAAAAAVASITTSHQQHQRGPPMLKVDVLQYMKKGTPFLKYGNHGYPHFRQFQLSDDNCKIQWFSQAKKLKDTQVELFDVEEVRLGQTTPNFQKHKAPELSRSSFSLIYGGGKKSLDVIAKDPNEFKIWTEGIKELIRRAESGELEGLKTLVLEIGVHPGRRSSVEIFDVTTGLNADNLAAPGPEDASSRPRALSSGNKQMYKDVAKNFLELKRKLNKRKEELREQEFYSHPQYENMQVIVKRVQESVNKINEWFQDGEYPLCDDEIWRASVDLESLKNMMKAVKTT